MPQKKKKTASSRKPVCQPLWMPMRRQRYRQAMPIRYEVMTNRVIQERGNLVIAHLPDPLAQLPDVAGSAPTGRLPRDRASSVFGRTLDIPRRGFYVDTAIGVQPR